MAYLHCHRCFWSQDDFWDENYNPITFLERNYTKDLLHKDLEDLLETQQFTIRGKAFITTLTRREFIARELERHADTIRNMYWRTTEEAKGKKCPVCSGELDID